MGLLCQWQMRRAARQYARLLGPHLQRAYGASEHYTAAQITTAVTKLGLTAKFVALGLATFLSEDEFLARTGEMPLGISYREARELVARFRPLAGYGSAHFYESFGGGLGLSGGGNQPGGGGAS